MKKDAQTVGGFLPAIESPARRFGPKREIHRNPFESVYAVRAEFDEHIKEYYVVEFGQRAAVVIARDGMLMLTAQYRFLADKVIWEIPGGSVDAGESPIDAAHRECLEETGFRCPDMEPLVNFRPGLDNADNLTHLFYSENPEQVRDFVATPDEVLDIAWVPLEYCLTLILAGEMPDCVSAAAIMTYEIMTRRRSADES